jgi:small subunit ribosomal protein S6
MPAKNNYELMVMVKPDLNQRQTEQELKTVREFIAAAGGEIYHEDIWGIRKLAYRIGKVFSAYYAIFYFKASAAKIKELNREITLEQNVMRHLIVKNEDDFEVKPVEQVEFADPYQPKFKFEKKVFKPADVDAAVQEAQAKAKKAAKKSEGEEKAAEKPVKKAVKKKSEEKEDTKKAEKPSKTEEIDKKLQSIINDPDIMDI